MRMRCEATRTLLEFWPFSHLPKGGREAVCLAKVGLFICLNHQLVHDQEVGLGDTLKRLQTEPHRQLPLFSHLHAPRALWHAVDAVWIAGAGNIDVAPLHQVAVLVWGQHGPEQLARPALRFWPTVRAVSDELPKRQDQNDRCHSAQNRPHHYHVQPPTTRGTMTICSAWGSNCSTRSIGLPGSTRKAVAPLACSLAKIRSASSTAAFASASPARASSAFQSRRSSPRFD